MKTVRILLYREMAGSVAFVALAFLALFFFIDFVEQLASSEARRISLATVAALAALDIPSRLYELAPIAVLIGTIYALARMAQGSEFTVLRTAGLGPGRALVLLMLPGAAAAALTVAIGEAMVPAAERESVLLMARATGRANVGATGVWLKDTSATSERGRAAAVHVSSASPDGILNGVQIYEFDGDNRLVRRLVARSATVDARGTWTLREVLVRDSGLTLQGPEGGAAGAAAPGVVERRAASMPWQTSLTPGVVASAILPLQTMSMLDLWRYSRHLAEHDQAASLYEQQLVKRALHPMACVVMVALALPFAYLQARSGGVSLKVFGGILLGISFVLVNNLFSHVGLLRAWSPWVAASMPSVVYLLLSMAAFGWLVRHR